MHWAALSCCTDLVLSPSPLTFLNKQIQQMALS